MDLFKVEESSEGGGGELSEVPTTGGCPLLGVPTYFDLSNRQFERSLCKDEDLYFTYQELFKKSRRLQCLYQNSLRLAS